MSTEDKMEYIIENESIQLTHQMDIFKCPITTEYMSEPVIASDGHIYEKTAINKWFEKNDTSPLTRELIEKKYYKCQVFNNMLSEFYIKYPELKPISESDLLDPNFNNFNIKKIIQYLEVVDNMTNKEIILLLKNKIFINFLIENYRSYNNQKNNVLIYGIIEYGDIDTIIKMISSLSLTELELPDSASWYIIHHVCCMYDTIWKISDKINVIKLMINKGININRRTQKGNTVLNLICKNNKISGESMLIIMKLLLDNNADPNIPNNNNNYPIHFICTKSSNLTGINQLKAINLLIEKNADVNVLHPDKKMLPLHIVIDTKNTNLGEEYYLYAVRSIVDAQIKQTEKMIKNDKN